MIEGYPEIGKDIGALKRPPNLADWASLRASWSWDDQWAELGRPNGLVNKAYECVDRHADGARASHRAIVWNGADGAVETYTYADLKARSNQVANALKGLGIAKGDRVFLLSDRIPELYFSVFGILKIGAIAAPLFSAFGPEPIKDRVARAEGSVIITTPKLLPKVNAIRDQLPSVRHVIVIAHREGKPVAPGDIDYASIVYGASEAFTIEPTGPEDWSIMHFTSGTTGLPKGAAHVHNAIVSHYATGKYALDLQPDDIYWCTADPGWVTGTSYGIFAPFSNGVTSIIDEGGFGARRWYDIIQKFKVTVWYTAPTALRLLMKAGEEIPAQFDLSTLRFIASVGEPLNPEAVVWGNRVFSQAIHDNWWQTETGAIMCANFASMPVRPGSMGRPFPGVEVTVVDEDAREITEPMVEGHLVVKPGWPSMFRTYWNDEERYNSRFKNGWYYSGDKAKKDADGYIWFVGRDDDVINTAGHLVSPFEVESVMIEHPAVAEAGVIGKPDEVAMEVVKAFVTLNEGYAVTDELMRDLNRHARARLGPAVAPREIEVIDLLPKTRSGKIMRRLLKARELGLPEGDTSTLEED
ncbi:MAG: acetate--CoA ligase [Chloroflexi bacterium HGW-Chloroflexi-9]|nr:MAG: acetate--CoA ligase [Chloroflexi bacterium HGW-Chloroflexi-9]